MAKIDLNNFRLVKSGNPDHDLNYINDILHAIVARLGDSVGVLEAIKSISSDATIRISGDKDRPRISALPAVAQANAYTDEAIANIPDSGINSVGASAPLVSSGGDDPVISMLPSGVSAGSVSFPSSITLDEWGRVVGITEGTAPVATSWGTIVGNLSDQTDISTALSGKIDVSEKGASFGVATLDSSGKLPPEQVPPLAITEPFVVSSEAEQLALVVQTGDVAVRNDLSKTFINATGNNNSMSDWVEMLSPPNAVVSVNDKTGAVVINKADVGLGNVDNTSDDNKPISKATQNALNGKLSSITGTAPIVVSGSGTTRNISHATSGVTAGTYTNATLTVDARGHVTSASSGSIPALAWGSIGGVLANQTDLQNALNARAQTGAANTWTAAQTFSFGAGGNVYIRPHLDAFGNDTNNGGAIYLGPPPVGATPKTEPTAAIEASWGGGAQPQVTIGVIRGGKKAWGTFYYTSGAGTGIRFGYGATQWLNLYSGGAAFSQPITAPDITATSDRRHKSSIRPLANALAIVRALQPRRYWNTLTRRAEVGLVAQEVQPVLPDVVAGEDGDLSVSYARIVAPLIGAVQELAARIEALEARRGAAE